MKKRLFQILIIAALISAGIRWLGVWLDVAAIGAAVTLYLFSKLKNQKRGG
jgi:hypothetical protein